MIKYKNMLKGWQGCLCLAMMVLPLTSVATNSAVTVPQKKEATQVSGKKDEPKPMVMVVVNGHELTVKEYAAAMQKTPGMGQDTGKSPEVRKAIIRQMVSSQLITENLKSQDIVNDKQTSEERTAALKKFADEHFPAPKSVDESVAFQFYQQHKDDFGIPDMVRISQIQFKVPEEASETIKSEVKAKADSTLKRLENGESFGKLAAELTENPMGKLPEGDLGYIDVNGNPWLKKHLENVPKGGHTPVLESPAGYEILMKTDVRVGLTTPYPNARDNVIQSVKRAEQQRLRDEYVADLAAKAKIEIKDAEIAKLFPNGIFEKPEQ